MTLQREDPTFGGQARIRRQWAELHGPSVDPAVAREVAVAELGADRLAPPAELRRVLGWPGPYRRPYVDDAALLAEVTR
jgi:hypothetical protein